MKKILLSFLVTCIGYGSFAQVVVAGVSPASVQGNYDYGIQANYGWPDFTGTSDPAAYENWGLTMDFSIPGEHVQGELELVFDGTPGVNPQGIDSTYEGCGTLLNGDMTGKIAVVYRNSCDFASKVFKAQEKGAVGVIIINRENATNINMTANPTGDGPACTIPAVIIEKDAGDFLVAEMASGPVVMFIGNKLGVFPNDVGSTPDFATIARYGSIPDFMANNGYDFDLVIDVNNYGTNDNDVTVTAELVGPSGVVYTDQVFANIISGDFASFAPTGGADAFNPLGITTWEVGEYTLTYTITIDGATDDSDYDNQFISSFSVTDDGTLSLARYDQTSGTLRANSFPSNATTEYKMCTMLQETYPTTNTAIEGFYFAVGADTSTYNLTDAEILLEIFEWNDAWTGIDPTTGWASITFDNLSQVGFGSWYPNSNDENRNMIYAPLDAPYILTDNQRYLACVQTFLPEYYFGYDNGINYDGNFNHYLQPVSPINIDGTTWYSGWSSVTAQSLGFKMSPNVGVEESLTVAGTAFPNPTNDNVTISVGATGDATLRITDISGRIAFEGAIALTNGNAKVDMSAFDAGVYVFNVAFENGQRSQFNVVKN